MAPETNEIDDRVCRHSTCIVAMAMTLFSAAGCSEPSAIGESLPETRIFFCGCGPCASLASLMRSEPDIRATIYYQGGEGDVRQFVEKHGIRTPIVADLVGEQAKKSGVTSCPAVDYVDSTGATVVIGNGSAISSDQFLSVITGKETKK